MAYRSISTAGTDVDVAAAGNLQDPGKPTGWVASDILVMVAGGDWGPSSATYFGAPSGWTKIATREYTV